MPAGGYLCREEYVVEDGCKLVGLENGQTAEETGQTEKGRQGPPFPAQTHGDHIHGASLQLTVAVAAPEHHRQGGREEFGGHAHHRRDPHPEDCARTTQRYGDGHTADVAHTHRGGQGRGEGLKMADLPGIVGIVILAPQHFDRMPDMPEWHKARIEQKEKAPSQQQYQQRHAPDPVCKTDDRLLYITHNKFGVANYKTRMLPYINGILYVTQQ